jgi:hypothetical protein
MLEEAGSRWDDWRAFDPDALGKERLDHYKSEIVRIIEEEYGQAPLFVLKEPRIARFAPLYAGILDTMGIEARYVLANRNPLAVAASLGRRDGFTNGFADLLWLRHALDAECATRSGPRVFISYEDLLADWRQVIHRITVKLGIEWPRATAEASSDVEGHLSADHQHHAASAESLFQDGRTAAWVKDAYSALKALERDPTDPAAIATLDRVKAEFDAVSPIFGEAIFPERHARQLAFSEAHTALQHLADERLSEIERLSAESERNAAEAAVREAQLQGESNELQRLANQRATEIAALTAEKNRSLTERIARKMYGVLETAKRAWTIYTR